MPLIRIHFAYKHVDRPWGGANNFIRALHNFLSQSGRFTFTESMDEPCDILFLNQTSRGPAGKGGKISSALVKRLKFGRRSVGEILSGKPTPAPRKLVVRAVNLNAHAFTKGPRYFLYGRRADSEAIRILNMADLVIFQSAYQKGVFTKAGYRGQNHVIIHNGADPVFSAAPSNAALNEGDVLRVVSSAVAPRKGKQHGLVAALSLQPNVEVIHFGPWPADVAPANVKCLGTVTRDEMAKVMGGCHYLFHPGIKDQCPNVVFEAVCAGLPVIYFDGPGSSAEIVGDCGFAMISDDFPATVAKARDSFARLRETVRSRAESYGVARAARAYVAAFESVLSPS